MQMVVDIYNCNNLSFKNKYLLEMSFEKLMKVFSPDGRIY